jgi:hypothetical protein
MNSEAQNILCAPPERSRGQRKKMKNESQNNLSLI